MKKLIILLFIVTTYSCGENGLLSQVEELKILNELYTEIQSMAHSEACVNAEEWAYTAIGAKACGGPAEYIAYPLSIDVDSFLEKVEQYTAMQKEFNATWGIVSDCSLPAEPVGIECVEGAAEFLY